MNKLEKLLLYHDQQEIYCLPSCEMIKKKYASLTIRKIAIDFSQGKDAYKEHRY